ncbi:MAG: DUF3553 domain-containing protein, partial [Desulfobacterales bacterium]|nr:DUF3553 domain-containing protein [Desulfobacterales bacterium]
IPPGKLAKWPGAGKNVKGLKSLSRLLDRLVSKSLGPEEAVEKVMEYYTPVLQEKFDDYPRREKELEQLIPMAGRYKKLRGFLDDLVLEPPTSSKDMDSNEKGESLTLSTIHSSKGLEWPIVIIIWVAEGRFPPSRAYNNPADLEEERRLMYVASTRAKDHLIMCYPGQNPMPAWSTYEGGYNSSGGGLSSFIEALPREIISFESSGMRRRGTRNYFYEKRPYKSSRAPSNARLKGAEQGRTGSFGFSRGDMVRHPAFGAGVVSRFISDDKVEVLFKDVGRKLLHMEHTTLEKA